MEHNMRARAQHLSAKSAREERVKFARFALKDMRPAVMTDRVEEGAKPLPNAIGHNSDRVMKQVYGRRKTKSAKATE
jgi:hypothetical protein